VLREINVESAEVVRAARKSLRWVQNGKRGLGTAVAISAQGWLLTSAHVVSGSTKVRIGSEGEEAIEASVVAQDEKEDLALLRTDAHAALVPLPLGDSWSLRAGDWVIALGHPWGGQAAVTCGSLIGLENSLPDGGRKEHEYLVAAIRMRPGYSGGPLIDAGGNLVGLNTMITGPDVGVAIPSHVVRDFLGRVMGNSKDLA